MPKSETSNPNDGPSFQAPRYRPNWPAAITCFLFAAYLSVALVAYDPAQSGFHTTNPAAKNPVGWIGANAVWAQLYAIGISTWLVPVLLVWLLILAIRSSKHLTPGRTIAMIFACVTLSGLAAMFKDPKWGSDYFPNGHGGLIGVWLYHRLLADALGGFGSGLLLGTTYCAMLLFVFTKDIGTELEKMLTNFGAWRAERKQRAAALAEQRAKEKEAQAARQKAAAAVAVGAAPANAPAQPAPPPPPPGPVGPTGRKTFVPKSTDDPLARPISARPPEASPEVPPPAIKLPPPPAKPESKAVAGLKLGGETKPAPAETKPEITPTATPVPKLDVAIVKPEETKKAKVTLPQSDDANYQFPPLPLLKEQIRPAADSDEEYKRNMADLVRILGEFDVTVTPGEIHVGPVITRYEVRPAPGVRVEKIAGLDKNLALGLKAQSVRILAPIPGKDAVGVEVPNQKATPVGMREILESEDWAGARAELPIALGKDVSGKPLVSDLTKMPHLLIAGSTGSGKSVCINAIIASILYSKSPKDVRLIMVDPKVVELKIFNSLPHMLIPVVTEPKKVPAALKWLLSEMEQRYQMFARENVRNILGFNNRKRTPKPDQPAAGEQGALTGVDPLAEDLEIPDRLPYIVAIIDELADLMMIAPAEIETSIARLAQLARAAGIHLIIATQRPSVNVVTGVIKANLPSRIAFQVASQIDSRTILDGKGAETLIGRGDMLFTPPGTSKLVRAQGAFVADEEIQQLVEFIKVNGPPVYAQAVQQQIDRAAKEDDEDADGGDEEDAELGDDSELYQQAIDVLKSTKRASTSMLQRRLRIGYNRAARIMEIMEEKGIVGPENGSSPREILVDLDTL
ncbi:MAG: DNA translocase FtsK 4TM domain-containing protein [Verrucomicrobia bacterium]|nr:DNA translocase FtsK 4TM domain-containing protein [Verrucomicrobiota bacterium]